LASAIQQVRQRRHRWSLSGSGATPTRSGRCTSFAGFFREAWHVLEPATKLRWGWHMDAIAEHLQAISDGQLTRLIINVPPGSSKVA
jgi:hypothetical protein